MTLIHDQPVGVLDQQALVNLRRILLRQRTFRRDQLDRLGRGVTRTRPSTDADREVERSLRVGARSTLNEIEHALARMRTGIYGRCVTCGSTVPLERLQLVPHTARCMSCQQARDRIDPRT